MNWNRLLFHTIAAEPARWTPKRVSRPVSELFPKIAEAGFSRLEIFEPHLRETESRPAIKSDMNKHGLEPVILSSYLNLVPKEGSDREADISGLETTIRSFEFQKVRIFPGPGVEPGDTQTFDILAKRLAHLAKRLPDIEILLETHDKSIADDPARIVELLKAADMPNIGLLFQPTVFEQESTMRQLIVQAPFIRHVHLQNRNPDRSFATLREGVIKWDKVLSELPASVEMTLEFTPQGLRPESEFDLQAVMDEAVSERSFVEEITAVKS